jgi:hypothetical protein
VRSTGREWRRVPSGVPSAEPAHLGDAPCVHACRDAVFDQIQRQCRVFALIGAKNSASGRPRPGSELHGLGRVDAAGRPPLRRTSVRLPRTAARQETRAGAPPSRPVHPLRYVSRVGGRSQGRRRARAERAAMKTVFQRLTGRFSEVSAETFSRRFAESTRTTTSAQCVISCRSWLSALSAPNYRATARPAPLRSDERDSCCGSARGTVTSCGQQAR